MKNCLRLLLGLLLLGACSDDLANPQADDSPLASFLGFESYGMSEDEQFADDHRRRQETIVLCMKKQGFTYVPVDLPPENSTAAPDPTELEFGEWVRKYGFGISTLELPQAEVGPDLVGNTDEAFESELVDPNDAIAASLDESSRSAYEAALYGRSSENNSSDSGCIYAWRTDSGTQLAAEFGDSLADLEERLRSDSRVTLLWQQASDCVMERGFQWFDPRSEDLHAHFIHQLTPVLEDFEPPEFPEPSTSPQEIATLSATAERLLQQLQSEEIRHAVVYFDCAAFPSQIEKDPSYVEVRIEYETDFLDANIDALKSHRSSGG